MLPALETKPFLDFYTPLDKAIEELYRRRQSSEIRERIKIETRLTPSLRKLLHEPHIVFFRQIATPLHDTQRVINIAKQKQLPVLLLEFSDDKFVSSGNTFKRSLGKLKIYQFTDKKGTDIVKNKNIVDFNKFTGLPLSQVRTVIDESLFDFHHSYLEFELGNDIFSSIEDGTDWFASFGHKAEIYYEAFFKLFLRDNILAEIFLSTGEEDYFTNHVVWPAFTKVTEQYNMQPLVWHYLPENESERIYWDCYPKSMDDFLNKRGYI